MVVECGECLIIWFRVEFLSKYKCFDSFKNSLHEFFLSLIIAFVKYAKALNP